MNQVELFAKFENWLKSNPERFTIQEKQKVTEYFRDFLLKNDKELTMRDELYDFFVSLGNLPPRHEALGNYIIRHYSSEKYRRVLDVGAGRTCKLSEFLATKGYEVTAIDPKIRLTPEQAKKKRIKITKGEFACDTDTKRGTNITRYDLIIGLEPCDATEHIIRQCVKYNKPCSILLCATAHDAIDGTKFENMKDWYKYLERLSPTINLQTMDDNSTVICNEIVRGNDERN